LKISYPKLISRSDIFLYKVIYLDISLPSDYLLISIIISWTVIYGSPWISRISSPISTLIHVYPSVRWLPHFDAPAALKTCIFTHTTSLAPRTRDRTQHTSQHTTLGLRGAGRFPRRARPGQCFAPCPAGALVAALRVGVGRRTRHHALLRERARQVQHTLSLTRVEGQGQPTFMGEVQSMPSSPCPHRQLYLFLCETRSSRALPGKKR